jgi:adenosylhomocysteinase
VIPRIFLREFVDILDKCTLHAAYDPMEKYRFEGSGMPELKEEERAVMEVEW